MRFPSSLPGGRFGAVLLLYALELLLAVRGYTTPREFTDPAYAWAAPLLSRRTWFGALLFAPLAWLVLAGRDARLHGQALLQAHHTQSLRGWLPAQIASCLACLALAWPLYFRTAALDGHGPALLATWALMVALCFALSLAVLAPFGFWRDLLRRERWLALRALLAVPLGAGLIEALLRAWYAVPVLAEHTLGWSAALLRLGYDEVRVDPASGLLQAGDFAVLVTDSCSGYLGVSLSLALIAGYGWLFRDELPRWALLLLIPIAGALSLGLNALRIALLVALGAQWSPEVAVNGFHTNAGSVAMVLLCGLLVASSHRLLVRQPQEPAEARLGWSIDLEAALLIPLLVLLAATLLTGLFASAIAWLYPLRVLAVLAALRLCRRPLMALLAQPPGWQAGAVGVAVFGLWLLLVPGDPARDAELAAELGAAGSGSRLLWIASRVLGATITVPIAEELAFRGYLPAVLAGQRPSATAALPFRWLPWLAASLMFGALHGDWLAGSLAGLAYGGLRYRSGRLADAVAAHACTNLLLAAWVLASGRWSYW